MQQLTDIKLRGLLAALEREESFVFLETTKVTAEDHRSFLFLRPVERLICRAGDDPALFLGRIDEYLRRGFYLAGWFAYEFGYLLEPSPTAGFATDKMAILADFGVYSQPYVFDHAAGTFTETGPWPAADISSLEPEPQFTVGNLRLNQSREDYLERVRLIKEYIEAGDTYQVNYTVKMKFDFAGSVASFYRALRRNQRVSYGAFIKSGTRRIISFSPELFFKKHGDIITVRPMKGTIGRGRTLEEDEGLVRFLAGDVKNRSENVMIVDLLRNDLGRLCPFESNGAVKVMSLFDVETYETLHQMTSTIQGHVRPDLAVAEMFRALFPCGSVTGAPKIRTMELIRSLELEERGVYTGAIGFFAPTGEAAFNVPIRTVVLEDSRGEMGIGSGIVYDSDPQNEWEECCLKGRFLSDPVADFAIIETVLWTPAEGFWLLDLHLRRLAATARYFGYPFARDMIVKLLTDKARVFAAGNGPSGPRRLRLTLAGDGTVEIAATPCPGPAVVSGQDDVAVGRRTNDLPRVIFSERRTDSASPYLYHKTTLRQLYDDERRRALAAGFYEVLFRNEKDEVTEGGITNIFIRKDGVFITPPVACGLLAGIFREYFMKNNPQRVKAAPLTVKDLEEADALYVANSVRGMVRVRLQGNPG